jgi:hypothetical protein
MRTPPNIPLSAELERQRILTLKEAAHLKGVSVDTLKRRYSHKILRLSPRRKGMRVRDALAVDPA